MVFQTDTKAGRRFDGILLLIILASLVTVMLDSIDAVHQNYAGLLARISNGVSPSSSPSNTWPACTARPSRCATPSASMAWWTCWRSCPGSSRCITAMQYLLIIRIIRMLRIFRVLKLSPYLKQANHLCLALQRQQAENHRVPGLRLTLVTVFGTLMYVIEGPEHGFTSIPKGIYWAIVTLTTVGFGDIVPKTPLGQVVSSLVMITGYSIIAVPTGIYAELANAMRGDTLQHPCPVCRKTATNPTRVLLSLRQCAVQKLE
jgi:voltage-gated potassium channel